MEELEILGRLTREAAAPVKRMSRHGPARAEQSRGGGCKAWVRRRVYASGGRERANVAMTTARRTLVHSAPYGEKGLGAGREGRDGRVEDGNTDGSTYHVASVQWSPELLQPQLGLAHTIGPRLVACRCRPAIAPTCHPQAPEGQRRAPQPAPPAVWASSRRLRRESRGRSRCSAGTAAFFAKPMPPALALGSPWGGHRLPRAPPTRRAHAAVRPRTGISAGVSSVEASSKRRPPR